MKNFTQFSQWLSAQPQMKVAEVINAAVQKGLAMNNVIMGLPSNYNNSFQSVFLYHYDESGNVVDDTSPEAEAIANSVLANAKSQLLGYSKYFKETKCGEVVGSTVSVVREYSDLDFGAIKVVVNKDTGQPISSSVLSDFRYTLSIGKTLQNLETLTFGIRLSYNVGCGYGIMVVAKATFTGVNGNVNVSGSGVIALTYMGSAFSYSQLTAKKINNKSIEFDSVQGDMSIGKPDMEQYQASLMFIRDDLGVTKITGSFPGNIDLTGNASFTKLVDNSSLSYSITDGQDLVTVLSNYFLDPEAAISMIP